MEPAVSKERRDIPVEVAAPTEPLPEGIETVLPVSDAFVGRNTVLAEEEAAVCPEDAGDLSQPVHAGRLEECRGCR